MTAATRRRAALRVARLAWVVPLSLLSFAFYRAVRLALRPVRMASLRRRPAEAGQWRLNATERDLRGLRLALMMTTGPRANAHAIVGVIDLLDVKESIAIDAAAASHAARSWSAVIYRLPRATTVAVVGSSDAPFAAPWREIPLDPGRYAIAMRYYHARDPVEFPAVRVDGADHSSPRAIPGAARSFEAVRDKRSLFYLCLHYYVFNVLDHRDWLPAAFVEREFLPAGNPQTRFRFGAIRAGQTIRFTLSPALLATHDVLFTLYNRHSFPVAWYPLTAEQHTTRPCARAGFYLLRMQQHARTGRFDESWISTTVDPPAAFR